MTTVTRSSLSQSVLATGELQKLIQTSVAVRYLLFANSYDERWLSLNVALFGTGRQTISGGPKPVYCMETSASFGEGYSLSASRIEFKCCETETDLLEKLSSWEEKISTHPWWGTWVSSKPFVGTLVFLKNGHVTSLQKNNPVLLYYHGIVAQRLHSYLKEIEGIAAIEPSLRRKADALTMMARRFEAMASQTQHAVFEQMIGTGIVQ